MENLAKRYGVTEKDILEWADRTPAVKQVKANKDLIAKAYVKFALGKSLYARSVSELTEGVPAELTLLVVDQIRKRNYRGCPVCYSKVDGDLCSRHGRVVAELYSWVTYLAGDDTGEIPLTVTPRLEEVGDLSGKIVRCTGQLNDRGELVASEIEVLSSVEKLAEPEAKQPTLAETAKPTPEPEVASSEEEVLPAPTPEVVIEKPKPPTKPSEVLEAVRTFFGVAPPEMTVEGFKVWFRGKKYQGDPDEMLKIMEQEGVVAVEHGKIRRLR